jgi:hypothetical protein
MPPTSRSVPWKYPFIWFVAVAKIYHYIMVASMLLLLHKKIVRFLP